MNKSSSSLLNSIKPKLLWAIFIAALLVSIFIELFIPAHGLFGIDGLFAFAAWFGFLACVLLVVIAKFIGRFIKRKDDYYDH